MPYITNIHARQILDSRGFPTIEVEVTTQSGIKGIGKVPSGASTGIYEALELRDNDECYYLGKGVNKAIHHVNDVIFPQLKNENVLNQRMIDYKMIELDQTDNKSHLGANAILGVSIAIATCAANYLHIPLYRYLGGCHTYITPIPMMNIINGGVHADNSLDFQEFMIMPIGAKSFHQAIEMGAHVFHSLKSILKEKKLHTSVGDEGGFAPSLKDNEEALKFINKAILKAGYTPKKDICIALDVAASEFYKDSFYYINNREYTSEQLIEYYQYLTLHYPIISIEDGLDQNDISGWRHLTSVLSHITLVGDDLFVTNPKRLDMGINHQIANAILIKPNQIGTITETLETIEKAKRNKYEIIISHRSGETEDTFIADLAIAVNAGKIKTGSLSRSERIAKYNRLLKIEEELSTTSQYGYK